MFIEDKYVQQHFRDVCGYDAEIELLTLEASTKNKKKGRTHFPTAVSEFVKGSNHNSKKIYVLLVNMQLLTSGNMLKRDDYGSVVEGFYRPFNALRATRPFVIIDEPHKFSRTQKAFGVIMEEIRPQCVIRYGATFSEMTVGRGKNKQTIRDYQNLLYDLNACESFNQGLIKGVAKEHFEPLSQKEEKVKLLSTVKNESCVFQYIKGNTPPRSFTLRVGESMAVIADDFSGIIVQAIDKSSVEFSNGQIKNVGEVMDVNIYMDSYQEQMLSLALERHFETERLNFVNRTFKIKTLALFFIDDITSYRADAEGKKPYLLEAFERLLKAKLEEMISQLGEQEADYREYLEASLQNISACHAGYFAQDNSSSDEDIANEVKDILNGKKRLLSFTDKKGRPVLRRFLFSKWTLKEGWDNPNVFTITKLRSSGSENSKLQEVGRGLRLPVDECGNRISNQEFTLNYIVDFTEADFANRLVEQINSEVPETVKLDMELLEKVAPQMGMSANDLFVELLGKKYIDYKYNLIPEMRAKFFDEYPQFTSGLAIGKVVDRNKRPNKPVKIRKAAYSEIRQLWETINQRYILWYDKDLNGGIEDTLLNIFKSGDVFVEQAISSRRDMVVSDGGRMSTLQGSGVQRIVSRSIPYGQYLKRAAMSSNIPIETIHRAICRYVEECGMIKDSCFNENSLAAILTKFDDWKVENLQGRFNYCKGNGALGATALTYADGTPREEIAQGRIGTKIVEGEPVEKYLYDTIAYDSPLEKNNITEQIPSDVAEVIVYGKIPRSSIAIPTITGGTYSPDFMYVVRKNNGQKELNIIVETKDVENRSTLRKTEGAKIECAKIFFDNLAKQGYSVQFRTQLNNKKMVQIVKEVMQ